MIFNGVLNIIFSPLLGLPNYLSVFIIASLFGSIIVFVNKKTIWTKEVKDLQKKLKEIEKKYSELKKKKGKNFEKEAEKLLEKQSEYMSKYMKHSFKPLIVSVIIALVILPWMTENYKNATIFIIPNVIPLLGGLNVTWLW
ncbi:MAG: EMC3/TMCO1 family protein, partial [Candidatus Aenigmatarchaeota archaeon]